MGLQINRGRADAKADMYLTGSNNPPWIKHKLQGQRGHDSNISEV